MGFLLLHSPSHSLLSLLPPRRADGRSPVGVGYGGLSYSPRRVAAPWGAADRQGRRALRGGTTLVCWCLVERACAGRSGGGPIWLLLSAGGAGCRLMAAQACSGFRHSVDGVVGLICGSGDVPTDSFQRAQAVAGSWGRPCKPVVVTASRIRRPCYGKWSRVVAEVFPLLGPSRVQQWL